MKLCTEANAAVCLVLHFEEWHRQFDNDQSIFKNRTKNTTLEKKKQWPLYVLFPIEKKWCKNKKGMQKQQQQQNEITRKRKNVQLN